MNSKDLLKKLEETIKLQSKDLLLNEFERGFKLGQLELLEKIKHIILKEGG